jgi:hypothetical protein
MKGVDTQLSAKARNPKVKGNRAEHHVCIYRYMGYCNMGPIPILSGLQEPL